MSPQPPTPNPVIKLNPWDYTLDQHIERVYLQRPSCGWRSEEVHEKWVQQSKEDLKTLYWVVLDDELPERKNPNTTVWVAGLYISKPLQSRGLCRASMHQAEQLAPIAFTTPPPPPPTEQEQQR
ncbi:hypothetical protein BD289DRAFT_479066 [Coniella lustricola]|uniref:Uncharacterized protein n=1 Tax=Coniella lustricola TaxID=2025994 RepID=A0A2T3AKM8_9PEZI|nr:hypothetical protein BD289DRAFT_479066 [Coniella lustricola]